ncbi:PhzF family phenazine biosynthesis protein [Streptomyces sparsus]
MTDSPAPLGPASPEILRYAAFTGTPEGGNPAGVVPAADDLDAKAMQALAAEVGYSETAFLSRPPADLDAQPGRGFTVRYFSPLAEVPFCGHATVAAAVALAERLGPGGFTFATPVGEVPATVDRELRATLTTVPPEVSDISGPDLAEALAALGWQRAELDTALPPRIAFAGARHLVLAAGSRQRLAELDYDFHRLKTLMLRLDLTTLQLVWREPDSPAAFHVRNPFPVGGVVEDPATGAAAAALGGYLRRLGAVPEDAVLTLRQGEDLGRPSLLSVELRAGDPRVRVSGHAVRMG